MGAAVAVRQKSFGRYTQHSIITRIISDIYTFHQNVNTIIVILNNCFVRNEIGDVCSADRKVQLRRFRLYITLLQGVHFRRDRRKKERKPTPPPKIVYYTGTLYAFINIPIYMCIENYIEKQ